MIANLTPRQIKWHPLLLTR